jgi:hypothetical protein
MFLRWWLCLLIVSVSYCVTAAEEVNCTVSQATFDADWQYFGQQPNPARLPLMGIRYVDLLRAHRGLVCSGVPLVAFDGLRYKPAAAWSDDPGLYLLVPELAQLSGLSIAESVDVLIVSSVVLAGVVGLWGLLKIAKTTAGRRIGVITFVLIVVEVLRAGQVYALGVLPAIACVPWIIFFAFRAQLTPGSIFTMIASGALAQTANTIRSYSGTALFIFAVIVVLGIYKSRLELRLAMITALLVGIVSAALVFHGIYAKRDEFLRRQPGAVVETAGGHVFWHSVYIGLGFISNPEVPAYRDDVAYDKAHQVRPDVIPYTPEYEQVMRNQVWELTKRKPLLLIENLLLKMVIVLLSCLLFTHVGLYAAAIAVKPFALEIAFWLAIGFSALPGIVVMPLRAYIIGMVVFCALYAACSIDYALQNTKSAERLRWVRQILFAKAFFHEP